MMGDPKHSMNFYLKQAHKNLEINDEDFELVATHSKETLIESEVENKDIETLMEKVDSLKPQIVS
jgi:hypothetical protein